MNFAKLPDLLGADQRSEGNPLNPTKTIGRGGVALELLPPWPDPDEGLTLSPPPPKCWWVPFVLSGNIS